MPFRNMAQRKWARDAQIHAEQPSPEDHCPVVYARLRVSVHGFAPVTSRSAQGVGEFPCRPRRPVVGRNPAPCRRSRRPRNRRREAVPAACDPSSETLRLRNGTPRADSTPRTQSVLLPAYGTLRYDRATTTADGGACSHKAKTSVGVCTCCSRCRLTHVW